MVTKKTRKNSGWRTPKIVKPEMKWSEIKEQALEPQPMYDDWLDYRDGIRDWPGLERKLQELKKLKERRIFMSHPISAQTRAEVPKGE